MAYGILTKTYSAVLFLAGGWGGFIGCIVGTSPHAVVERYDHFPPSFLDFFLALSAFADMVAPRVCVCVRAAARACADVRVSRTHGPGLGSHDWEGSRGQKHCGPQTAPPSFPITKHGGSGVTPSASLFQRACLSFPHTNMSTHPRALFLPLFLSEMSRSSHSAEFPTTVTLFSMPPPSSTAQ